MPVAIDTPSSRPAVVKPNVSAGQTEPLLELIQPYAAFPKEVTGRTVWKRDQFISNPEVWQHHWTPRQIELLDKAYDDFAASGKDLTEINKYTFTFPQEIHDFLSGIRDDVINGPGFTLIKGLPTKQWPIEKSAAVYLGIGTVFGWTLSQNGKGHVLGHVEDIGNDPTQIDKVRIYSTAARQFFHTDAADIVGLLCLHRAKEGGESDVVSAHHLWNTLQAERPDVAELLTKPNWYFDRKGEVSEGQNGWVKKSIFYWHDGKLVSHYDPYFVKSIGRHVEAGLIPGHTQEQLEAIQVFEETAQRLALHMVLEVGDIQLVADTHVFHARTAYVDHPPPAERRHLLRLWLSTPEAEGGWKRPFPDSGLTKRGGIQVNQQKETCPLDAE